MQKTNDFTHGALFPMILKFSIPAAISLLITAIYNIVDRMFVGNFVGTSALAGLSICFPLSFMMVALSFATSIPTQTIFIPPPYYWDAVQDHRVLCSCNLVPYKPSGGI